MGPLVESSSVAWVDPFATAAVLGDKAAYPAFSRTIPTSENTAATFARLALEFGWTDINTICMEDPYPKAVIGGFEAEFKKHNGTVHISRCLSKTVTEAQFADAMRHIEESSPSRVLVLSVMTERRPMLLAHLSRMKYDERFLILLLDVCLNPIDEYYALKSTLCIADSYSDTLTKPFRESYTQRNTTVDQATATSLSKWAGAGVDLSEFTDALPYAHDATLHAMRSLALRHTLGNSVDYPTAVRNLQTSGLTGAIKLDPTTGDRPTSVRRLYNTRGGHHTVVGEISAEGKFRFLDSDGYPTGGTGTSPPPLVLLGGLTTSIPAGSFSPPTKASNNGPESIVVAAGVILAVVLSGAAAAVAIAYWWGRLRFGARDNRNAPSDSLKPFTIVFTDIQASTALWSHVPEQMSEAVDIHHATIRRLIAQHDGYEVKAIGDAFMVAFVDATDAISFSLGVQRQLFRAEWPSKIDETYTTIIRAACKSVSSSTPRQDASKCSPTVWNGLRVRIGVHHGLGKVQVDPVSKGYDYYGTVVNTAARVEAVGHGGQTLVTAAAIEALHRQSATLAGAVANDLGAQRLRGLTEPVALYELLPSEFAERTFPPLRLDVEVDDDYSIGTDPTPEASLENTHDTEDSHDTHSGNNSEKQTPSYENADAVLLRLADAVCRKRHHSQTATTTTGVCPSTSPSASHRSVSVPAASAAAIPSPPRSSPLDLPAPPVVVLESPPVPRAMSMVDEKGEEYALPGRLNAASSPSPSPRTAAQLLVEPPAESVANRRMSENSEGQYDDSSNKQVGVANHQSHGGRVNQTGGWERSRDDLVFLVSFLRKMHSVVPAQERHGIIAQYAKRWHAKVTTPGQVRRKRGAGAGEKYCADVSSIRTTMALVERVWLTLDA